jgi:hypothetical protein
MLTLLKTTIINNLMKKNFLAIGFMCAFVSFTYAQVGINTDSPQATLDVSAKRNSGGTITDNNQLYGLQAPRLTHAELTAITATYGANQKGALIYITDATGTASGQRVNINAIGYYYFDGAYWQKMNGAVSSTNDWHITGNLDAEISTATETLGSAPASANYLGAKGLLDDLVMISGGKTHAVINNTGGLAGGGENTSSLVWGYNNVHDISGSKTYLSSENVTILPSTTEQTITVSATNAANVAVGMSNRLATNNNNFPSVAIGSNNTALNGGRAFGTNNYVATPSSYAIGNLNVVKPGLSPAGGYMFGLSNEGSGFNFGAGTKTAVSSMAIGARSGAANAQPEANAAQALYLGMQGGVATAGSTLYSNNTHVFATNTDASGNPIANAVAVTYQYTKVGINTLPSSVDADLQISKAILIKPSTTPAIGDNCTPAQAGMIGYGESGTVGTFYGCKRINSTTLQWVAL